jgi:hypothetical protein
MNQKWQTIMLRKIIHSVVVLCCVVLCQPGIVCLESNRNMQVGSWYPLHSDIPWNGTCTQVECSACPERSWWCLGGTSVQNVVHFSALKKMWSIPCEWSMVLAESLHIYIAPAVKVICSCSIDHACAWHLRLSTIYSDLNAVMNVCRWSLIQLFSCHYICWVSNTLELARFCV